ncbi:MAG: ABC transporter ATP-binding protein [Lentisphaerae bacterium]|nr:ABC transporter ATP-binding protein [Lentisphaerota bacterium]
MNDPTIEKTTPQPALFKRFCRYYKPYMGLFVLDMVCALIVSAVDLAFPQFLNVLSRIAADGGTTEILRTIGWIAAALAGLYLIRLFAQYFITCWGHIMGARMETDMRQDIFEHYQRLSFSYFDRNNTGEMMSRIVSDLFDITELAHHGPEIILLSSLKVIGAFVILSAVNWQLTLILLVVTLAMTSYCVFMRKYMRQVFADNRKKIALVNSQIQDSLAGIRVVKSFANEEVEQGKFADCNRAFLDSKVDNYRIMGRFHAGNSFFQGLLYVAILLFGGIFIAKDMISLSELAIYALYIGIFVHPLEMLINFTEQFQRGWSGFRRFAEVLATVPEVREAENAVIPAERKGVLEYKNVNFEYEAENMVLNDVSFAVEAGSTVALVGPSGGGKSTICALLPRFYDVISGSVLVDGVDVRKWQLKALRNHIGIVQQDIYMFSGTVRDNITYGKPHASQQEIEAAARRANIHDFIMTLPLQYDTEVGERGVRLSGGQKQRIAIARVFLKNPPILILDEATSALDNESERHIQAALQVLSRGRTTLVIAHRLSTIRHADKIIAIEDGRIAEIGSHEELLAKNGIYSKYHRMQFGV